MSRHPTYTITVAEADAPTLVDRLNAPRSPEDETTDPGLGPRTTPEEPSALTGLVSTEATVDTPTHRWITLSVRPEDVELLESIVESVSSAEFGTWHPDPDVESDFDDPDDLPDAKDLNDPPDPDDPADPNDPDDPDDTADSTL